MKLSHLFAYSLPAACVCVVVGLCICILCSPIPGFLLLVIGFVWAVLSLSVGITILGEMD